MVWWRLGCVAHAQSDEPTADEAETAVDAEAATVEDESQPETEVEARALFVAAQEAYRDGRYEEALDLFERSYARSGRPELLYNVGLCHERLSHDAEAVVHYRRYLAGLPEAPNRVELERRITVLEAPTSEGASVDPGPWIVVGLGAAAVVTGVVFEVIGVLESDQITGARDVDWSSVSAHYDNALVFSGLGTALLLVGAAAVTGGIVWAVVGSGADEDDAEASVSLGVGLGAGYVRGRF